jgi:4-amino-4-deoxy-L-arabinose transferase-like glycosyltransferase
VKTLLLFAVFAALFCARLGSVGLIDYDEAAYAQAAREMFERGDALAPSISGEPFFEKPPLLYWLQMLGYRAFGVNAFAARIGNALAALATLGVLYGFSRRPLGRDVARLAVLVLGSSLAFVSLARVALTDLLLLLALVTALGCMHRAVEAQREGSARTRRWLLGFGASCGLAMLAKGAVGALLPLAAAAIHVASLRRLTAFARPSLWLGGALALLAIGLSWYLLLGLTRPGGFAFMRELFLEHHVARFTSAKEGHRGPFFYYLPVLAIAFAPWSAFVPLALARWIGAGDERGRWLRLVGLLAGVTLVFFSLAATKLPHYLVPALPGLALLVADRLGGERAPGPGPAYRASIAAALLLLFALAGALFALGHMGSELPERFAAAVAKEPALAHPFDPGPALPVAAIAALATAAVVYACRRSPRRVCSVLGGGMIAVFSLLVFWVTPRWDDHFQRPLRELAATSAARGDPAGRLLLVGLRRKPSVAFYGGRPTEYVSRRSAARIAARLDQPPGRLALASEADFERLAREAPLAVLAKDTGYVLFRAASTPLRLGAALGSPGEAKP